jgi:hypothetical protein
VNTARPLKCHKCGSTDVRVLDATQFKGKENKNRRLHAKVRCGNTDCNNDWWSKHKDALEQARVLDQVNSGEST